MSELSTNEPGMLGADFGFLASPFFGKLSDRTTSRFGMRRPWLIAGVIGTAIGLLIVAFAQTIPMILLGWCVTNVALSRFWLGVAQLF